MSIKYAILGILAEKDQHGYEIKAGFDAKIGEFWSLNFGQIYSTLDRLEKDGLVTHDRQSQDKRPDRKIFSITPIGEEDLNQWLATPVTKIRALRDEFFIKLVFMDKADKSAILELIDRQKILHLQHMNRLTRRKLALKAGPDNINALTAELLLDASLFHAEADIRWLTLCEEKIKAGGISIP
jgi:DNA-binding PadR family transcriptional regulator